MTDTWQKESPNPGAWGRDFRGREPGPSEPEVGPGSLDVRNEVEPGSGAGHLWRAETGELEKCIGIWNTHSPSASRIR
ncbi:26S Proteasome Non-Atpase Regulatory Subunit 8 [Manis pentadactyla]|nr:26S Proteasome Non-Atpase Regulatory Subunit 8 [Manis pentadactyla]